MGKIKKIDKKSVTSVEYIQTLAAIKQHVQESQLQAILAANKELIELYWSIGKIIAQRQEESGWGTKIIERLAGDLKKIFPEMKGFSRANVFYMRAFYKAYADGKLGAAIVQQPVGQLADDIPIFSIPWGHNVVLLDKIKDIDTRFWYATKAVENGWSRSALEANIKSKLHRRMGKAITNFQHTLPSTQSQLAQQTLKDPYVFDFLTLRDDYVEKDLEYGMMQHVQRLLLELGKGFSFVAQQYHLEVGGKDYYIDLLFYHFKLRCFVVVELKAREFDPRDAGQLNFYLSAIDDLVRQPDDKPTIGLLLCKTKNNIVAEYALRDVNKPIGVAGYEAEITARLPKSLKGSLPTIEEIEAEFMKRDVLSSVPKRTSKKN